jgi:hypothetical protein
VTNHHPVNHHPLNVILHLANQDTRPNLQAILKVAVVPKLNLAMYLIITHPLKMNHPVRALTVYLQIAEVVKENNILCIRKYK